MYESFYGLQEKPFNLLPDPEYIYMSYGHENAYTHLEYAITENKGFVVITGEIGSGKTTLINYLLSKIPQYVQVGIINHTDISPVQLIRMFCQEFELDVSRLDKAEMLDRLNEYFLDQYARRNRVVLIIDEAQNLPRRTIEEIRMMSNLEAEKHHLVQIILVGQPELRDKLQAGGLEQLVQRISVHCHIDGLDLDDVHKYITHRLEVAGARNLGIFDDEAIETIHRYSRGIPRVINVLCDTSLVYGYADDQHVITRDIVQTVVDSRQIGGLAREGDFFEVREEAPPPAPVSFPEQDQGQLVRRLDSFERRLLVLETNTALLEKKLDGWWEKREQRDSGLSELVKMLKDSLRSRQRLLAKYLEMRTALERVSWESAQNGEEGGDDADERDRRGSGGSLLTRWRGGERKRP